MVNDGVQRMTEPCALEGDSRVRLAGTRLGSFSYRLLAFLLAALYGATLSQIPNEQFNDFANYLIYAEHSWEMLLGWMERGLVPTFANEPVWLLINSALGAFFPPETVVRIIIFFSAGAVAWLVLAHHPRHFIWLILFLLLPAVVKNYLIHLRQGAAIALFLWGWYSPRPARRWLWMGLAPFVHASFFFVLAVLFFSRVQNFLRFGPGIRAIAFVGLGVLMGIGLGWLAALFGVRQAEVYEFAMAQVSGLGFLLWCSVAGLWILEGRRFLLAHAFEMGMILFYLATYWFVEVTARIFESGLILVLLAGLALTEWRRYAFLTIVLGWGGLMWLMNIGQAGMGFIAE